MLSVQKMVNNLVHQRERVWQDYERAVASEKDLTNRFARQFEIAGSVTPINPLTAENHPPEEVLAVIARLNTIENQINGNKASIQSHENEIEILEKKARQLIIALSATVTILVVIAFFYIKHQTQNNNNSSLAPSSNISLIA